MELGRFEVWDVLKLLLFFIWDALFLTNVMSLDVLLLGHFVLGPFAGVL